MASENLWEIAYFKNSNSIQYTFPFKIRKDRNKTGEDMKVERETEEDNVKQKR